MSILKTYFEKSFRALAAKIGVDATWNNTTVRGYFDDETENAMVGSFRSQATDKTFTALSSAMPGVKIGDKLIIQDETYSVSQKPKTDSSNGKLEVMLGLYTQRIDLSENI